MRAAFGGLVAVVAIVVAGSCGGGESSPTRTSPPEPRRQSRPTGPTKSEFIRKADRICVAADRRFDRPEADSEREGLQVGAPVTEEAEVSYISGVLAVDQWRLSRLRSLTPPPEDERIWATYLEKLETLRSLRESDKRAVLQGERERSQALLEEQIRTDKEADGLAKGYGFRECGARS